MQFYPKILINSYASIFVLYTILSTKCDAGCTERQAGELIGKLGEASLLNDTVVI